MPFPIAAAIGLAAEFAPGIIRHLVGDGAGDVAEKVADVAKAVTGREDADEAAAALRADPALALKFKQDMAGYEVELEKAYLADRQDARARDVALAQAGRRNTRADLMVLGAGLILIACLFALISYRANLPGEAVGIISTIAGIAGACLKDAFAYEFGSSRGSAEKSALLARKP